VSHIFCEGNVCADKLASLGPSSRKVFKWYTVMSSSISLDFYRNRFLFPLDRAS